MHIHGRCALGCTMMIANGLTPAKAMPDFVSSLYIEGLATVRPEAVDIIGAGEQP